MWSLGVTLYTFVFGEHPFFEVDDTIRAELFPPFKVSNGMFHLDVRATLIQRCVTILMS